MSTNSFCRVSDRDNVDFIGLAETLRSNSRPTQLDVRYEWIGTCRSNGKGKGGLGKHYVFVSSLRSCRQSRHTIGREPNTYNGLPCVLIHYICYTVHTYHVYKLLLYVLSRHSTSMLPPFSVSIADCDRLLLISLIFVASTVKFANLIEF
jgi:hypothetical protein